MFVILTASVEGRVEFLFSTDFTTSSANLINEFEISESFCKTAGLPASDASLIDWTIGISANKSIPNCSAKFLAPCLPKI